MGKCESSTYRPPPWGIPYNEAVTSDPPDGSCINLDLKTLAFHQNTATGDHSNLGHQWGNEVSFAIGGAINPIESILLGTVKFNLNLRTTSSKGYDTYVLGRASLLSVSWRANFRDYIFRLDFDPFSLGLQGGADVPPISQKTVKTVSSTNWTPSIGALYMYMPTGLGAYFSAEAKAPLGGEIKYDDTVEETTETNGKKETKKVTKEFTCAVEHFELRAEQELFYAPFINDEGSWFRNTRLFIAHRTEWGWWNGRGENPVQIQNTNYSSNLFLFGIATGYRGPAKGYLN